MKLGPKNVPIFSLVWEGKRGGGGGGGAALTRVFINNHVGALGFALSPHRQEEGFKFTLLNEQNDFRLQAPGLLLVHFK